ncbi:nitroreductase [bacterium SCN 62-11]|nr:nitroreductase family protein [Candidatus Eremiobacteraeota bacterium]ODT77640.1 MAG: nitroreductase [bacterium SCN 62-11]
MDIQSVDHLLTTTRSVRKRLDFDRPVEREVVEKCLDLALQAPTGSNLQGWRFVIVGDADKRKKIADLYRKAFKVYANAPNPHQPSDAADPRVQQRDKIVTSAVYLAENMWKAPFLVIPCYEGRVEDQGVLAQASFYGSILPAAWSFMLALRSRGLGTAWTTLHLMHEKEAAEILGIPDNVTQTALLPVAYFQGEDFQPAKRLPVQQVISYDSW